MSILSNKNVLFNL